MRCLQACQIAIAALAPWLGTSFAATAQSAQPWPDKPVKVIVPFAPGGGTDTVARPWTDKLGEAFGQPFVIDNRGGAAGVIGTEVAAKSAGDGYTLLIVGNSLLALQPQLRKTPYDPIKSFIPVAFLGATIGGFAVHPATGIKTMAELIDHAKKNPGKLAYGSAGLGSSTHMRIEMLKLRAGIDILHVPYRGSGDSLTDLLANNVQLMNEIVIYPHVRAGKLTLLAVNHSSRHPEFPDVPTLTEAGVKDADVPIWFGLYAPAGTPASITERLNAKVSELMRTVEMKQRLTAISVAGEVMNLEALAKYLADDIKRNGEVIKAADVKLD